MSVSAGWSNEANVQPTLPTFLVTVAALALRHHLRACRLPQKPHRSGSPAAIPPQAHERNGIPRHTAARLLA